MERRDVLRSVFPSKRREPFVSWAGSGRRMTRRKGAKLSLGSSDEARSGVALGGDDVVGSK